MYIYEGMCNDIAIEWIDLQMKPIVSKLSYGMQ